MISSTLRSWTALGTVLAILTCTVPVSAVGIQRTESPGYLFQKHFESFPSSSEIRVGNRQLRVEKAANGFIVRDLQGESTVVLTLEDLDGYEVRAVASGTDGTRFQVVNRDVLGTAQAMELQVAPVGTGFRGTIAPRHGVQALEIEVTPESRGRAVGQHFDGEGPGYVSGEYVIVVSIVITAAALGVIGCAALALLMDCGNYCIDACNDCQNNNGNCYMVGFTEGLCGQCDCRCECSGGSGVFEEHQDGCH